MYFYCIHPLYYSSSSILPAKCYFVEMVIHPQDPKFKRDLGRGSPSYFLPLDPNSPGNNVTLAHLPGAFTHAPSVRCTHPVLDTELETPNCPFSPRPASPGTRLGAALLPLAAATRPAAAARPAPPQPAGRAGGGVAAAAAASRRRPGGGSRGSGARWRRECCAPEERRRRRQAVSCARPPLAAPCPGSGEQRRRLRAQLGRARGRGRGVATGSAPPRAGGRRDRGGRSFGGPGLAPSGDRGSRSQRGRAGRGRTASARPRGCARRARPRRGLRPCRPERRHLRAGGEETNYQDGARSDGPRRPAALTCIQKCC